MYRATFWEDLRYEWLPRVWRAVRHPLWEESPLGWLIMPTDCKGGGYLADTFTHVDCGCAYDGYDFSRLRWWTWALRAFVLAPTNWRHPRAWRSEWYRGHAGRWARD